VVEVTTRSELPHLRVTEDLLKRLRKAIAKKPAETQKTKNKNKEVKDEESKH